MTTPQPAATPYDRQPTSDAERVRWLVGTCGGEGTHVWVVGATCIGRFDTPELAACAVWDHNVMVAAREQAAMREAE